jgi:hypothetical protein
MTLLTLEDVADRERRRWVEAFTWHLDQLPPLMETMGVLRLPSIPVSRGGSRFDKLQITGGGFIDNIPVTDGGAHVDQAALWAMLVEYARAATAWVNIGIDAPWAPELPPIADYPRVWAGPARVDADPLLARRIALQTTGWLIDHADAIEPIHELDEYREQLFIEIRRMRARYRSAGTIRRARPRTCGVCGESAVIVDWIDAANGSPRPVQVGRCKVCGQIYQPSES